MTVGERIRAARKEQKMTQKKLAEKSGIIETTIRKYEAGTQNPKLDNLKKIASALDIQLYYLVFTEEPDREYELISDTLNIADYGIEQSNMADLYYVFPLADPEDPDSRREFEHRRIAEIVRNALSDAEERKREFLKQRIAADLYKW